MAVYNTNVKKQRVVIVAFPIGEPRTEAVHGFVNVYGLDHGWKPSKCSLLCLALFERKVRKRGCFSPYSGSRSAETTSSFEASSCANDKFSHRPQSSKPRTFSIERAAKSERKKVNKYQIFGI